MSQEEIYEAAAQQLLKEQQAFYDEQMKENNRLLYNAFRKACPHCFPNNFATDKSAQNFAARMFANYVSELKYMSVLDHA